MACRRSTPRSSTPGTRCSERSPRRGKRRRSGRLRPKTVYIMCAMMRKALGLAAALAVLSVISVAVAQSRRPQPPALEQATRALIEGRYDEVAGLLEKLDAQDPAVAALIARAHIARGRYAGGRNGASADRAARADERRGARTRSAAARCSAAPTPRAVLTRVAAIANTATDATDLARGARALRALGRFQEAKAAYRDAATAAPRDPAINTAWGDLFLEKYNKPEALKSFQAALRVDPTLGAGAPRLGAHARRRGSAAGDRDREDGARDQPVGRRRCTCSSPAKPADAGRRDEARKSLAEGARGEPVEPRGARAARRRSRTSRTRQPEFEAEVAQGAGHRPELRRGVPRRRANWRRTTTASTKPSTLVRQGARARSRRTRAACPTSASICCGPATSRRRARRSSSRSSSIRFDVRSPTTCSDDGHARQVRRRSATATSCSACTRTKRRCCRTPALALAHQALEHAVGKRYEFTPKGPILIEMFPKHDDFAVRNVGLPGMIGALGACFGRVVTMDSPRARRRASSSGRRRSGTSWRTSSRCRCRTSACRAG